MKTIVLAALAAALPLHADTLADVRAAVMALRGTQPIRATVEMKRNDNDSGRFSNDHFTGAASVDVAVDDDGVHLTFPPAFVERVLRERRERRVDEKRVDPTTRTVSGVGALWVLEHLNATDTFLGLLRHAALQSETRAPWQGRPARLLVFRINEPEPEGFKGLGSVGVKQHQLKVWIGDDNLPFAAERVQEATPRVLFFHGTMKFHETWSFGHVSDHLVVLRHDSSHAADMLGQKSNGETSDVITLR
jgi:hypothetical protein